MASDPPLASQPSPSTPAAPPAPGSKGKGVARLPFVRNLVTRLIDSAALRLLSLETGAPSKDVGLDVKVLAKVSDLGLPLPLNAKITFTQPVELCWMASSAQNGASSKLKIPGTKRDSEAGQVIAHGQLDILKLKAGATPGNSSGETRLRLDASSHTSQNVGALVKKLLRTPTQDAVTILLRAHGVTVKAYGFTFKGLALEKKVPLGGLGGLGGAVRFPDLDGEKVTVGKLPTSPERSSGAGLFGNKRSQSRQRKTTPEMDSITVEDLMIIGGHPEEGILISAAVNISLAQPGKNLPDISVPIGDLSLGLFVPVTESGAGGPTRIGSLVLAGTTLKQGNNRLEARGSIKIAHDASGPARMVITALLENRPSTLLAMAAEPDRDEPGASPASWLSYGFAGAQIVAILPALGDRARLIDGAQLRTGSEGAPVISPHPSTDSSSRRLSRSSRSNSMSDASSHPYNSANDSAFIRVTIYNSFNAEITLSKLRVKAYGETDGEGQSREVPMLGIVETGPRWEGLRLRPGESVPVSLPFELNSDPAVLVRVLKTSAAREGVELGPGFKKILDRIDQSSENEDRAPSPPVSDGGLGEGNFAELLTQALAHLTVAAHIEASEVYVGDYAVPGGVSFVQRSLAIAISGSTGAWLLPRVGTPLVTQLVEEGRIELASLDVHEINENGLVATATLKLAGFGPLSAQVFLDGGLAMKWTEGERKGEIAAYFNASEPLQVEPDQETTLQRQVTISPVKGGASSSGSFAAFASEILCKGETLWQIESNSVRALAGGVEFPTTLSKTISIFGFGGFPDLEAREFDIIGEEPLPPPLVAQLGRSSTGDANLAVAITAHVELPNSSNITISLSRLELELLLGEVVVGQVAIQDVHIPAHQTIDLDVAGYVWAASDSETLGRLASDIILGKPISLTARGKAAMTQALPQSLPTSRQRSGSMMSHNSAPSRKSETRVAWLDSALRALSTNVRIQAKKFNVVNRVELESLTGTFPQSGRPSVEIGALFVRYEVPFPIDVVIESVSADVEILLDGEVVGTGRSKNAKVLEAEEKAGSRRRRTSSTSSTVEHASGLLKLALDDFALDTENHAFSELIKHVFDCEETNRISLRGQAFVTARTVLGQIPCQVDLGHVPDLKIKGMRSLRTSPTDYTGLQVIDGTSDHLQVTFDLFLNNPSENVTLNLPDSGLSFAAYYRGANVGRAHVGGKEGPFKLTSGPCAFRGVNFYYSPKESEEMAVRQLPANFLSGQTTTLEIRGDEQSTSIAALQPAISSLRLSFDLRPLVDRTLIASIEIALGAKVLTANAVECSFVISNPLMVPIDLLSLAFVANYKGKPFGTSSIEWPAGEPLRVMPGTMGKPGQATGHCHVRLAQRLDQLVRAFLSERGQIYLQVELSAGVEMGGYKIPVFEYVQERLPLDIKNLAGVSKLLWALPL
ncbi:hypothetical protein BCV69DRAFT_310400 [Microstroma glucosiphilum]|uniref:Uncharacterized protein n=1 Tax=Pseudomicrostroma glucosiphilum TaxID=1684307 RepID=A0A316UCI1_9BASI|nr:hypothetical protein BCV69DRAFT_310400 [Pseudomicrostroma glucosiphilum]PWN22896.1 hypothetical protein BCV69DRAFT_310400 [Pseudomicrostroma glucosiphilum]